MHLIDAYEDEVEADEDLELVQKRVLEQHGARKAAGGISTLATAVASCYSAGDGKKDEHDHHDREQ